MRFSRGAKFIVAQHKEVRVLRVKKYSVCLVRVHGEIYRLGRPGSEIVRGEFSKCLNLYRWIIDGSLSGGSAIGWLQ